MEINNNFFDLNQLPKEEGILLWGISMSKIGNTQSPANCFEYLQHIDTKITKTDGIGMVVLYGDYLYFHSDERASVLRDRYKELMISHKSGFLNLLAKNPAWIKKAFSFSTFGQIMLDNSEEFKKSLDVITGLYRSDDKFKEKVESDCKDAGREITPAQVMFILEEVTLFYLAAKGKLDFGNRFISGTEQWVLQMYPGKPLQSEVYLFQSNPLNLHNPKNKYENHFYDLEGKVLYDYLKM